MEKNVQEATDLNHRQVVALQDHYEQRLVELQQNHQARITSLQKQIHSYHQGVSEDTAEGELQRLQNYVEEMEKKFHEESSKVEELRKEQREKEKTYHLLNRQIEKLQAEKLQLKNELKMAVTDLEVLRHQMKNVDDSKKEDGGVNSGEEKLQSFSSSSSGEVQGCTDEQSTTSQVIQEIQDTRTKLSTCAVNIQSQLLQERQDIVDQMLETEKQKVELKSWLGMLEAEKSRLSEEIKEVIRSLGKDELLGYINALEEENLVLKNQNKDAELQLPEGERISSLRPEPLGESSSDTPTHNSCVMQSVNFIEVDSVEDEDHTGSEISARNKKLCAEVKVLQLQVENYEQEIEQLQWLLSDKQKSENFSVSDQEDAKESSFFKNQITQLEKGIASLKSENEVLRTDVESTMGKMSAFKEVNKELQMKLNSCVSQDSMKESLEEKDSQIHELMEEKLALEISLEELDAQHQEAMEKILLVKQELVNTNKNLSKDFQELQEKCLVQEDQMNFLKVERETLQEQFMNMAKKSQEEAVVSSSSSEVQDESPPLKSILEAVNTINADNLELEEKMSVLENQRRVLESKLLKVETDHEATTAARDLLENECLSLKLQIETLQNSLAEAYSSKEEEKSAREIAEEEISSLRVQLKEMESIVLERSGGDQQQQSDAELMDRIQELTSEKDNLQNEADDLWTRMVATTQEVEALNLEIGNIELANRKLQEEIENIQVRYQLEIQRMEDKLGELEKSSAKQHDEDQQKQEVLQRELVKLEEKLIRQQELEGKVEELQNLLELHKDNMPKQVLLEEDLCESDQNNRMEEIAEDIDLEMQLNDRESIKVKETELSNKFAKLETEKNLIIQRLEHELKTSKLEIKDLLVEIENMKMKVSNISDTDDVENHDHLVDVKNVNDFTNILKKKDSEIATLNGKIDSLLKSVDSETLQQDKESLEHKLRTLEIEKEQMLSVMNEKSRECSSLKAEVHRLVGVVSAEKQALFKLQQDNQELVKKHSPNQELTKEAVQKLSRLIKDRDIELEASQQKNSTLLQFIQQSNSGSECLETLLQEKEEISKQLLTYKSEREQIITILQQKHQESLQYHGEMQRLNGLLVLESQKYESLQQQYHSVSQSFEEKQKSLVNTQNEVVALKARVTELERQYSDIKQKYVQLLEKDPEIVQIPREDYNSKLSTLEQLSSKVEENQTLIREKDRLIYELNKDVQDAKEATVRKEENVTLLQKRLDDSGFQLAEAQRQVIEAGHGKESMEKDLERLQEECTMLKETNRNLSMMVKQLEFEKSTMQEKAQTMTQILQQQSNESESMQTMLENREALEKQAQILHQERDQTMLALSQKQAENINLQTELFKLQERFDKVNKELDRLRQHLIEVEENFTQEALLAEDREKDLRNRLVQAEERASLSSNAIHMASYQASMQVESLQKQVSKLSQEREHALNQISMFEDRVQEREASNTNLQVALKQIQRDQKRELQEIKKEYQILLKEEAEKREILVQKLEKMQNQLTETSEALDAASRLSEQLDRKEEVIAALKDEVSSREHELQKAQEQAHELRSHTEGKVDKQVMKSLMLGYFGSANAQKPEVIRLLARMLDFSHDEMNRVGLKFGKDSEEKPSGWLSWIVRSPPTKTTSTVAPAASSSVAPLKTITTDQSFTAQFVQFLEDESRPRPQIRLPVEAITKRTSGSIQLPSSIAPSSNVITKKLVDHPLLKPISTSLPTFAPLPFDAGFKSNSSTNFLQEVLK